MRYYTVLKRLITILVILYFFVGNFTWEFYKLEIFPIYSWDLFSYIPNLSGDYGLKINAINGEYLDPPLYYQDAADLFNDTESIITFNVIQTLGQAIDQQDNAKITAAREQIETLYFGKYDQVEYELKKRTYYASERWRSGQFESEERLATYDTTR